jgi:hypothetical protein
MRQSKELQRWYPSPQQLKEPGGLERAFRQVLAQHYDLQDQHAALLAKVNAPASKPTGPPPGSGPTDTMLCGLRVAPVDSRALANGATLKWVAADGRFKFS